MSDDDTRELQIDINLQINVRGRAEVSRWMLREQPELVYRTLVERLTEQVRNALRESIARQLGATPVTPDSLGEVRDLLREALDAGPLDYHRPVGRAWTLLRRICAASEEGRRPI